MIACQLSIFVEISKVFKAIFDWWCAVRRLWWVRRQATCFACLRSKAWIISKFKFWREENWRKSKSTCLACLRSKAWIISGFEFWREKNWKTNKSTCLACLRSKALKFEKILEKVQLVSFAWNQKLWIFILENNDFGKSPTVLLQKVKFCRRKKINTCLTRLETQALHLSFEKFRFWKKFNTSHLPRINNKYFFL